MEDTHKKIEAVLFTTGKFLTIDEISQISGIESSGLIKDAIRELIDAYALRDSALEIIQQGNTFKLNLRKDYLYLTTKLLSNADLDKPTQETLALIAYKTPAMQSEIVNMRGTTAYEHIQKLKELEFITSEKSGRTRLLKTTGKFYEYFDVVASQLQQKFSETLLDNPQNPGNEQTPTQTTLPSKQVEQVKQEEKQEDETQS